MTERAEKEHADPFDCSENFGLYPEWNKVFYWVLSNGAVWPDLHFKRITIYFVKTKKQNCGYQVAGVESRSCFRRLLQLSKQEAQKRVVVIEVVRSLGLWICFEESTGFHVMLCVRFERVKDDLKIFYFSNRGNEDVSTEMGKTVDKMILGENILTSVLTCYFEMFIS